MCGQELDIFFHPTPGGPELMTVSAESGMLPRHLVMDPGHWTISMNADSDILLVSILSAA